MINYSHLTRTHYDLTLSRLGIFLLPFILLAGTLTYLSHNLPVYQVAAETRHP